MDFRDLEDIKKINMCVGNEKLEGNCLYKHNSNFKYRKGINEDNLRYNLYVLGKKSKNILEIGLNAGHSAVILLHANTNAKLVALDIATHKYTEKCVEYLKTKYNIEFVKGNSLKTLKNFDPKKKFDLIHIDGGHGVKTAESDIVNCRKLADKDTIIIVDDTNFTRLRILVNNMVDDEKLKEVDYIAMGLKPTRLHRIFRYEMEKE
jgi:precorrin-6B methylase 2